MIKILFACKGSIFTCCFSRYSIELAEKVSLLWVIDICRNYEEKHHNEEGWCCCGDGAFTLPVKQGGPASHETRLPYNGLMDLCIFVLCMSFFLPEEPYDDHCAE